MSARPGTELLLGLPRFTEQGAAAYLPGLERMRALLAALGDPHTAFDSVHVAGTNGKGSTSSFIASIASALGLRVGLHTSPHLIDVTERMRVDGVPADPDWLEDRMMRYRSVVRSTNPSFFEATTALSFLYFAEMGVDLAIIEVGLGGRLDATNVLHPRVCAITQIGLDHVEQLGSTLPEIAREKAGIAKPGVPVVVYPAEADVMAAIREVCSAKDASVHEVSQEVAIIPSGPADPLAPRFALQTPLGRYDDLRLPLAGAHQQENAAVAVRATELALNGHGGLSNAVRDGLATVTQRTGLRGRMEILRTEPLLIADVAHNPDGLQRVLQTVNAVRSRRGANLYVVFAVMADKDVEGLARLLYSSSASVFCVSLDTPRALDANAAAAIMNARGVEVEASGRLSDALASISGKAREEDIVLVTGSHVLVGQLLDLLRDADYSLRFGTSFAQNAMGQEKRR